MKRTLVAVAVTAALCTGGALAQTPAAPAKTAPKAAAAAAKPATATSSDKVLYKSRETGSDPSTPGAHMPFAGVRGPTDAFARADRPRAASA